MSSDRPRKGRLFMFHQSQGLLVSLLGSLQKIWATMLLEVLKAEKRSAQE